VRTQGRGAEGWEVIQDQAGDPERRSKMLAERRLPRGTTDIQGLSALGMFQMHDAGVIDVIDYGRLKNTPNLLPSMKYSYGVGHIYSGNVGIYNPKLVDPAPRSYKDIFDPKRGNKLGIIDIQYQISLICAALAAGGKVDDLEPGKKLLLECKKAGARIYPTNEAFALGLKAEEIEVGVMWKARVVQWQNAGISVEAIVPWEGALAYVSGFVIPKNAPNKAGAYAYLDAMLDKRAQEAFAIDMGYNPTVTNAVVAPELADAGFAAGSVAIEFRWANLNSARLSALAADLVDHQVAVLFASNAKGPLRVAKAATATIPIVFFYGGDPVQDGFVASLNRPGGNMTGVTGLQSELAAKGVEILHELIPQAKTIALLTSGATSNVDSIVATGRMLGVEVVVIDLERNRDLERVFATMAEHRPSGGLIINNTADLIEIGAQLVALAKRYDVPTIYPGAFFVRKGGLVSYGTDVSATYRQAAAHFVGPILKGPQSRRPAYSATHQI
jgi:putative spermidine/putrescine transport system substrate-binding protein